jgi:hypothetical protein
MKQSELIACHKLVLASLMDEQSGLNAEVVPTFANP